MFNLEYVPVRNTDVADPSETSAPIYASTHGITSRRTS